MGKKLITVGNYQQYVNNGKLYMTSDYIITAGAKDTLRVEGIELVYGEVKSIAATGKSCNNQCFTEIDKVLVEMLVKDFKLNDPEKIRLVVEKVKSML